jgi:acylphosphatase
MSNVTRHVVVRGRVQGVGFRAWAEDLALRRGVAGWVRNRRDGSVEAVFSGPADAVAAMVAACRQGPGGGGVNGVAEQEGGPELLAQRYSGESFSVLPTI